MSRSDKTIGLFIAILIILTSILSACANSNIQPNPHGQNGGAEEQPGSSEDQPDGSEEQPHDSEEQPSDSEEQPDDSDEQNDDSSGQESQYEDGLGEDGKIHVYLVGNGEKVSTPKSSFIVYIVYYKESEHLIVCINNKKNDNEYDEKNGKEYVYANISESLWEDFKKAESTGTFYNAEIKGHTKFFINDYNGKNGDLIVLDHIDN